MASNPTGAAKVAVDGKVTTLGPRPSPNAVVTTEDVKDPTKLAALLGWIVGVLSTLMARWYPRRIDFEDVTVGGAGATVTLEHGFGGRVRWWVVDWIDSGGGGTAYTLNKSTASTTNTLVLTSFTLGLATIRVEESG